MTSDSQPHTGLRTVVLTMLALVAFAANSILCRMALGDAAIDAPSFTLVRLASGAATLACILAAVGGWRKQVTSGSWSSAAMLFLYAAAFSFAYLSLSAGTGALILFGAVQVTMILGAIRAGHFPSVLEWVGLVAAMAGLVYLVSPGLTSPPLVGAGLMAVAGCAWGVYSLRGRGTLDPLADTAGNFLRSLPLAVALSVAASFAMYRVSWRGLLLAVLSGALASGVGYVLWYAALRGLTATRAAIVQLSVPLLAAVGGILFLSERISFRLTMASVLVLGGIAIAVASRRRDIGPKR
ncbi:MAG: DMT family transporter [Pirellulales bacterium]